MRFHLSVDVDYLRGTGSALPAVVDCLAAEGCLPSLFVAGRWCRRWRAISSGRPRVRLLRARGLRHASPAELAA